MKVPPHYLLLLQSSRFEMPRAKQNRTHKPEAFDFVLRKGQPGEVQLSDFAGIFGGLPGQLLEDGLLVWLRVLPSREDAYGESRLPQLPR